MSLNGWAISQEVFDWIMTNIERGSTILEFGSGSGSDELAKYYKLCSIEHDISYVKNTDVRDTIYAPIVNYGDYSWYDVNKLIDLPTYNFMLIDGPPGAIGRIGVFKNKELFNWKVPIILDDTHREAEQKLSKLIGKFLNKIPIKINSFEKTADLFI